MPQSVVKVVYRMNAFGSERNLVLWVYGKEDIQRETLGRKEGLDNREKIEVLDRVFRLMAKETRFVFLESPSGNPAVE